jgi:hypothetical protein
MRIKYDPRYIREHLKDRILIKGIHYIQPFGRRKILFIWNEIEKIISVPVADDDPMAQIKLRRKRG